MSRTIRLVRRSFPERPELDTAVSRALLERVSAGREPETLRLHRPSDIVAFGKQDTVSAGYREAVGAARAAGFAAVERLAGGRAAVFHPRTIAFSWAVPEESPRHTIGQRFSTLSGIVVEALRELGVDAHPGEVPGEYCPGTYSVNARGVRKIMGVGQRLARRAAHVGGVVVVGEAHRVRHVLLPVYRAMQLAWDPSTVGSIEDEVGPLAYAEAEEALLQAFARRFRLEEADLAGETLVLAEQLAPEHRSPGDHPPTPQRSIASLAPEKANPGSGPPATT